MVNRFNEIDLPIFNKRQQVDEAIKNIIDNNLIEYE